MKKFFNHLCLYTSLLAFMVWVIGFCIFVLYSLSFKYSDNVSTDAVVALTGGTDRIKTAVQALDATGANYLLISGVNKKVTPDQILKWVPEHLINKVTLGYLAEDTVGNAKETAEWIQHKNINSILLVTSFYHMPRSQFEILKKAPNLTIIPHPVFPETFGDSVDWIKTRYAWLLFIEYHKFLAVQLKYHTLERFLL